MAFKCSSHSICHKLILILSLSLQGRQCDSQGMQKSKPFADEPHMHKHIYSTSMYSKRRIENVWVSCSNHLKPATCNDDLPMSQGQACKQDEVEGKGIGNKAAARGQLLVVKCNNA